MLITVTVKYSIQILKLQKQPPEVFYKKTVRKNFAKFTGKQLCQQGRSHWGEGSRVAPFNFQTKTRSTNFSFKHQGYCFLPMFRNYTDRNFAIFTVYATIFGKLWRLFIFSNYLGEIDRFTFDLLKRSNT